ncbi:hypothetical protein LCGC14_1819410, partial [marine sediment metagenome]
FTVPQIVRSDGFNTVSDLTSVSSDICVANATGACLQNEAASNTNPTVVPNKSDDDTGIGHSTNTLNIVINGVNQAAFNDQGITASVGGARLRAVTPTATVPNILPLGATDPNTGIGWPGADQLSLVAGGVASLHVRTTGVTIDTSTIDTLVVTTRSTITATGIVDLSSSDASTTTEGLVFPQHATACSGGTAEGQVCWEADANILHIGDSSALQNFLPASAFTGNATVSATGTVVINSNAVDGTMLALGSDAQGDIMYYDGTDWVILTVGASDQVLATGGSGANPAWTATSPSQATQSALEAETDENTYAPPDLITHSPGVAKAWVQAGLTANIVVSYNVSSVEDPGTGIIVVNWDTDFSGANYVILGSLEGSANLVFTIASAGGAGIPIAGTATAESRQGNAADTLKDPSVWHITAFGDQ